MKQIIFPEAKTLSFSSGPIRYNFKTALIIGVCRSGKTTFGNLLATSRNVESAEEPWTAKVIPLMTGLGLIDERIGKETFLNYITELFNDMILLRRANFRPSDLSAIYAQKDHEEIFLRLTRLYSREDVKCFINKHSPLLLLNLTEVLPFANFFLEVLPGSKLLHIVRRGLDLAYDCLLKGWFSDEQLIAPIKPLPYLTYKHKGEKLQLPWWITRGEEELFISYSEYERCVYYWCQTMQSGLDETEEMIGKGKCMIIHYEEIIKDPRKAYNDAADFLRIVPTPLTEMAIAKIKTREKKEPNVSEFNISSDLRSRVESLYSRIYN